MASSMFYKIAARHREEKGYRMMICLDALTLDDLMNMAKTDLIERLSGIEKTEFFSDLQRNVDDFVFHREDNGGKKMFVEIENKQRRIES